MNISALTTPTNSVTTGAGTPTSFQAGMNGDDFMLLLLTQMRHQDPLEPMDDQAMMSQFTQLNSLQQLQQINTTLSNGLNKPSDLTEAAGLIGKTVETDAGISGTVTGVSFHNGQIMLWLDDQQVPLSSVTSILEGATNDPQPN